MNDSKTSRIEVRMTIADKRLIRAAAETSGQTLTDFMVGAAVSAARDVLADRTTFVVDAKAWDEFTEVLDRPAQGNAPLERLLAMRPVFEPDGV